MRGPKTVYHPDLGPFDPNLHVLIPIRVMPKDDEDQETPPQEILVWQDTSPTLIPATPAQPDTQDQETPVQQETTTKRGRTLALMGGGVAALVIIFAIGYAKQPQDATIPDPTPVVAVAETEPPPEPPAPAPPAIVPTPVEPAPVAVDVTKPAPDPIPTPEPPAPPPVTAPAPVVVAKSTPATPVAEAKPAPPAKKADPAPAPKTAVVAPPAAAKPTPPPAKPSPAPVAEARVPTGVPVSTSTCTAGCTLERVGNANIVTCSYGAWEAAKLTPITGGALKGCLTASGLTPAVPDGP